MKQLLKSLLCIALAFLLPASCLSFVAGAYAPLIIPGNTEPALGAGEPVPTVGAGDVNLDGSVSAIDARRILRISVALETPDAARNRIADFDRDGLVTAADARLALRASIDLDDGGAALIKGHDYYQNSFFSLRTPEAWGDAFRVTETEIGSQTRYAVCDEAGEALFTLILTQVGTAPDDNCGTLAGSLYRNGTAVYDLYLSPADLADGGDGDTQTRQKMLSAIKDTAIVPYMLFGAGEYLFAPAVGPAVTSWIGRTVADVRARFGDGFTTDADGFLYYAAVHPTFRLPIGFCLEQGESVSDGTKIVGVRVFSSDYIGGGFYGNMDYVTLMNVPGVPFNKLKTAKDGSSTLRFKAGDEMLAYYWSPQGICGYVEIRHYDPSMDRTVPQI
ncbi:MAG: dockerin type I repeat-containing protein [Clostridia bacterium]|nr:dockerin type I repeat-containing protein [Clostridia bacterium]